MISFIDSTPFRSATIVGFQGIASSLIMRGVLKPLWGGSIKSTLNAPNQEISGMNAIWHSPYGIHRVQTTCRHQDQGELLSAMVTRGNVDDRQPVPQLCRGLFGKLFADKGYIAKNLREILQENGVTLIHKVRKNMKPEPLSDADAALLKKRMLIESVNKELKSQTEGQHTRHRSCVNFQVNTAGLFSFRFFGYIFHISI